MECMKKLKKETQYNDCEYNELSGNKAIKNKNKAKKATMQNMYALLHTYKAFMYVYPLDRIAREMHCAVFFGTGPWFC